MTLERQNKIIPSGANAGRASNAAGSTGISPWRRIRDTGLENNQEFLANKE
ncbi:MAG: hypothetical protein V4724_11455 [Pseudomonadota bacterium]